MDIMLPETSFRWINITRNMLIIYGLVYLLTSFWNRKKRERGEKRKRKKKHRIYLGLRTLRAKGDEDLELPFLGTWNYKEKISLNSCPLSHTHFS